MKNELERNGRKIDPRVRECDRDFVYGKGPAELYLSEIAGCGESNCIFEDHRKNGVYLNENYWEPGQPPPIGCRCCVELMRTVEGKKAVRTIRWLRDQLDRKHEWIRHIWATGYRPSRDGF